MSRSALLFATLVLAAGVACAQQEPPPSADEGPQPIRSSPPQADKDGVFSAGPGIENPIVLERAEAVYPADASFEPVDGFTLLRLVISAEGAPSDIQVVRSHGEAYDNAAIESVKQSKFEPGALDGKPVPVRIYARIRFSGDRRPAYPRLLARFGMDGGFGAAPGGTGFRARPFDKPPVLLNAVEAEYSDKARKAKLSGVVLISVMVTEDGQPTDIQVMRSLGMGLDEKAVDAVSRYRFKPATKNGVPVATRINVEVNFRTY